LPEKAIPGTTYTVSGGTLNPTQSLTQCCTSSSCVNRFFRGFRISCKQRVSETCNCPEWWLSLRSHI